MLSAEQEALPLRGREIEVGLLSGLIDSLARGEGGAVLVEGPSGSGRTRLLAEARAMARAAGVSWCQGEPGPDRRPVPLRSLVDALRAAGPARRDVPAYWWWTPRRVRDTLARRAGQGPLAVCIDDIEQCDPMTLSALPALLRGLSEHPVLWVLATGTAPGGPVPALARVGAACGQRIGLGPLSDADALGVAADVLREEPDEAVTRVVRRAQGVPQFIVEMVRGMEEEGFTLRAGAAEAVPRRMRVLVRHRLGRLSPSVCEGVQAASVLDGDFSAEELGELAGMSASGPAVAAEAVAAGILTGTNRRLGFCHDLVREAISADLPAPLRRCLRRQAVDVRLMRGGSPVDVAAVLAETALPGDHRAVALLREAAASLAATDPAEASELSRGALRLAGPESPQTAEIIGETMELLWRGGRTGEARKLAEDALSGFLTSAAEARIRLELGRQAGPMSATEAVRQCRIGLSLPDLPSGLRARLTAAEALHLNRMGDVPGALAAAARVVSGPMTDAVVLAVRAGAESSRLNQGAAFAYLDRADSLGLPDPAEACGRAFLLSAVGRTDSALREAGAGLAAAARNGQTTAARLWSMTRARLLLDAGRLTEAVTASESALASAGDLGAGDFAATTARYARARAALRLADTDGPGRCVAEGARMEGAGNPVVRQAGAWLAALAADAEGAPARAAELARRAWDGTAGPGAPPDPADLAVLARIALRGAMPDLAAEAATRAAVLDDGFPLLRGVAFHTRGLVTGAPDLLAHAAGLLADTDRPLVRACAAEDAGRVLKSDPAARGHLETALRLYDQCGADRDAARVRRRLRALGVRPPVRETDGEARWGLTATEVRIARLVAQGATNRRIAERLFLSSNTVGTHLRHIFVKWGIGSRVDLARLVHAHETA
ncbi:helix-turn-helix transcriptional regulator [Actinocorallia herbida]|uniref:helix-turn-helix transcriptional regulator n=1 Tax=Actinocorallia herbida TaxID=58109 RepID=UPI001476F60F|nr:LuxR family transcriptional regulator [Actinocorallia herbida]